MSSVQQATEQVTSRFGAANCDQIQAKQGMLIDMEQRHANLFSLLDPSEENTRHMNTLAARIKILKLEIKIEKLETQIAATTDPGHRSILKIEKLETQIAATTDPEQRNVLKIEKLEIKLEQAVNEGSEPMQTHFSKELEMLRQQQRLTQGAQRHPSVHSLFSSSLM
jgi:hypothetical protein